MRPAARRRPSAAEQNDRLVVAARSVAAMRLDDVDEPRENFRWRFRAMLANHLEQRLLAEPLSAAAARIAETIREQHEEVLFRIPGAARRRRLRGCHAERWIFRCEALASTVG